MVFLLLSGMYILFANESVAELTGLPSGESGIGRNIFEFVLDDGRTTARYKLAKVKEGHPLLGEYRITGKFPGKNDGSEGRGRLTVSRGVLRYSSLHGTSPREKTVMNWPNPRWTGTSGITRHFLTSQGQTSRYLIPSPAHP